jgi:hypothetical protein
MSKFLKLIDILSSPSKLFFVLTMPYSGYLKDIGWFESFKIKEPVDENLSALPWVTYPFIHFIESRLINVKSIFEYGSGNSTLYYSRFVGHVVSVEHDQGWYENIKKKMPENVKLFFSELVKGGGYSRFCAELDNKFDIIIVDGRDRVNCLKSTLAGLASNGVVVLDDSERDKYTPGVDFMLENGFKRIDFWGISPGLFYKKCTTIFYKNDNVLGI